MEWYNILTIVLGAIGGIGGISGGISIYQAKSNKESIDIENLRSIISEERLERESLKKEYAEYKVAVDERIIMFKKEFEEMKEENKKFLAAIYMAYRCKYPSDIEDCPVIRSIHENGVISAECEHNKDFE